MPRQQKIKLRTPEQALQTLEWMCSKMERCALDARRSLVRWGVVDRTAQDQIIEKLQENRFIDHSRYASIYVRDKIITGRWGTTKIRMGLRAKQIEPEIIEAAIQEHIDPTEQTQQLKTMLQKMYDKEHAKIDDPYKLRARLFSRAAYRGYDPGAINTTLQEIFRKH